MPPSSSTTDPWRLPIWRRHRRVTRGGVRAGGVAVPAWVRHAYLVNPLNDGPSAEWCRTAYQQARIAADSATVDRNRVLYRRNGHYGSVSCSEFRRAGKIRG